MTAPTRVVYVTGPDCSGSGTLIGALREFGLHVPGPEVAAPGSRPDHTSEARSSEARSSEPQWVVDLHTALLRSAGVEATDARPIAWHLVDRAGAEGNALAEIRPWLAEQTAEHETLVIKDPRLLWFLEYWQEAATGVGAAASSITVLRPPAEAVADRVGDGTAEDPADGTEPVDRVAGWINLMLGTELATRAAPRAFVRHHDLLHDWEGPVFDAAAALDLPMIDPDNLAAVDRVDALIGSAPPEADVTWDDVPVPAPLRGLADDTWAALDSLPEHDDAGTRAELDRLRALYPYVHRRVASPARQIAQLLPAEAVPPVARQHTAGTLWRSSPAARWPARRGRPPAR
ncbi:hypothetical protein AB1046_13990 [Promicromonospora sp. Populi]|uniref:hypothetical protein n=1 Tax=Promicromonospora sp. Populi TaxID=3239420 RepID=UPI0034E1F69A